MGKSSLTFLFMGSLLSYGVILERWRPLAIIIPLLLERTGHLKGTHREDNNCCSSRDGNSDIRVPKAKD